MMADGSRYEIGEDGGVRFFKADGKQRDVEAEAIYADLVKRLGSETFNVVRTEINQKSLDEVARGKAADWVEKEYKSERDKRIEKKAQAAGMAVDKYKKTLGYRLKQVAKVAGFGTVGFAVGGLAGAGMGVMVGLGGQSLAESLKRSTALRKKYNEIRKDENALLGEEDRQALAERAMIVADEDLNANGLLNGKRGEKIERVEGEHAKDAKRAFVDKIVRTKDGILDQSSFVYGLEGEKRKGLEDFVEEMRSPKLSLEEYRQKRSALEAYVEKNAVFSEAKMNAGLGMKEVMKSAADEKTLDYGVFAGAAMELGGQLVKMAFRSKVGQALGGGNPIKIAMAAAIGGVGTFAKTNRDMKRENIQAAIAGEDVKGEGTKYSIVSVNKLKSELEGCFDGEKIKDDKKTELITKIANFCARNKLQNEKNVALLAFSERNNIEKEKLEMFKLIAKTKRALSDNDKAKLEEEIKISTKLIEKNMGETLSNRRKAAIKAGFKGAVAGAVATTVLTYGMEGLQNIKIVSAAEKYTLKNKILERYTSQESTQTNGAKEQSREQARTQQQAAVKEETKVKENTYEKRTVVRVENRARDIDMEEYMNDSHHKEVIRYNRVNFDGGKGVSFGKPERFDDGYHIPVRNAPEGARFAVNVGMDGRVLTAEVHDGYALLPANSAIYDTVQNGGFTGKWVSVGSMNADGSFTSFASIKCREPFDGTFSVINKVNVTRVITTRGVETARAAVDEIKLEKNFETVKLGNGESVGLPLVKGGYEGKINPFWAKSGEVASAAFGEPIMAETPTGALEEWVVNVQKSPDQLVWNAVCLDGFNGDADVEKFFVESFGGNWRLYLGVSGAIDTEEEVNLVANAIAKNDMIYENFKRLFLRELSDRLEGGSVIFKQIASGGRFTNLMKQVNQFISGDSDVTKSIIRSTFAKSGGKGFVLIDENDKNVFDDKMTRKLLRILKNQPAGEVIIKMDCGGQMTRELIISVKNKKVKVELVSQPASTPTPQPTPQPEPGPTPTPTPEPTPKDVGAEIRNAGGDTVVEKVQTVAKQLSDSAHKVDNNNLAEHTAESAQSAAESAQSAAVADKAAADAAAVAQQAAQGEAIDELLRNSSPEVAGDIKGDLFNQFLEGEKQ